MSTQAKQSSRRERKKDDMRRRIVDVAMRLFEKQGYDKTFMEQIGEEADIAKATLYHYFPSKEAIVTAFVQRSILESSGEIERTIRELPDTSSRLVAICKHSFEWARDHREIYLIYFSYRMQRFSQGVFDESERSGKQKTVEEVLRAGQESGEIRRDIPIEAMAASFEVSATILIVWLLNTGAPAVPEEAGTGTVELFLKGAISRAKENV
jgi:AcrR family transcriptional regulator